VSNGFIDAATGYPDMRAWLTFFLWWMIPQVAIADRYLLVVEGLGGEAYYTERFGRWVETLTSVGEEELGIAPERIIRLRADAGVNASPNERESRKENVLGAIAEVAASSEDGDLILVVLIGHGTARGERVLFNLPGADLSPQELNTALDALTGRTVVVVNTSPASAPFVESLAGDNRINIAATASAAENQHTRFGGFFVSAFVDATADLNKDRRVSLLEAFQYANRSVSESYREEDTLRSEHAILDDNGDGIGSRTPGMESADGTRAAETYPAEALPGVDLETTFGRAQLALQVEATRLVDEIEALKRRKASLTDEEYAERLEALLLEVARNRRTYRENETQRDS
jgi:hypothetical protein